MEREPSKPVELRASDGDREQVVEVLREAFAEGRLTAEEHAERVDAAYTARTHGELVPLTEDLPAHRSQVRPKPREAEPGVARSESPRVLVVFGGASRKGRWRPGNRLRVIAIFGGVEIDLTEAEFDASELVIRCTSVFGGVSIRVPEGVTLHGSGAGVFGAFDVRENEATDPSAPVVIVRGAAIFSGVDAKVRRAKIRDQIADRLRKQLGN